MSNPANATSKSATVEAVPESPTTARPLEMDDDDVQEPGLLPVEDSNTKSTAAATSPASANAPASSEAPPPKPPRPVSRTQEHEQTLKEAFPTVEPAVIKAILTASAGDIERAFIALLQMTDPDAAQAELPPPAPPRRVAEPVGPTSTNLSQLEADELYARQLAERYENYGEYEARTANRAPQRGPTPGMPRGRQQTGLNPNPNDSYDREHSFLDDDLPVIKESLRKGFVETQTKFNSFFNTVKKKFEEAMDEEERDDRAGSSSLMGRPSRDPSRRSADYDRYDNDPELLSDDFAGMKFRSDGTPVQNNRAFGNPNLFKPPPPSKSPKPGDSRRVAFSETVEDIDAYNASPKLPPKDIPATGGAAAGGAKASKWQPLSTVEPSPIADNDPFSLGDSEDEREVKDHKKDTTLSSNDADALRKATADAMADSLVSDKPKAGGSGDKGN
ncbi:CUE domain-containing protein 5 [Rhypophila decipiens]|uniref:CUE domain-containing protein 5 n=1 Tax=Rhypophila decipiens TaxID=261697 RepID=A0AAN6YGE6_9PEZI|nr:CUE domain-containing protein 5 [Rhypophila decipiens]